MSSTYNRSPAITSIGNSPFSMFDMMLQMQQIGLRTMSMYEPVVSSFWTSARSTKDGQNAGNRSFERSSQNASGPVTVDAELVVPLGEEVLTVGTRMVPGKTTRVRRVVVETPVQKDVTLHTETVVLEHRRPQTTTGHDVLTEVTYEMSDVNEVPVVTKSVHLTEEVLLRKEVTARIETIHDTVKRDKLEVDDQTNLPVVFNDIAKQEEKKQAAAAQDKKAFRPVGQNEPKLNEPKLNEAKLGEQKRQQQ